MPYEFPLSKKLKSQRWKIKVWDREGGEDPHVTIMFKENWWRWSIRRRQFMDTSPDPADIPKEVLAILEKGENYRQLCLGWNGVHPDDPVNVPPVPKAAEGDNG